MKTTWLATTGRHVLILSILSFFLISFGTTGYMLVEDYSLLDAIYMTIITLTTVGFGEIRPLGPEGRLFTIFLIIMGAGFVAYNLAYFSQLLLDGNWLDLYRRRKLKQQLDRLVNHYIVCGYGQMGQIIVQELQRFNTDIVVIEKEESLVLRLGEKGILHLAEDAIEEENLIAAGIHRAKGLVSVVSKDTDNVFIVLTARDLNKDLLIFSRAGASGIEKRLIKAGANRVVSPFAIGAIRIAHNIVRPTVTDFLELALSGDGMELSMEEICIPNNAALVGAQLKDSGIRSQYNLIIVAIKRIDGRMVFNPSPEEMLQAGDIMVAIGQQESLSRFGSELYGCPYPTIKPCKC